MALRLFSRFGLIILVCLPGKRLVPLVPLAHAETAALRPAVVEIIATGDGETTRALDQLVRELVASLPVELE